MCESPKISLHILHVCLLSLCSTRSPAGRRGGFPIMLPNEVRNGGITHEGDVSRRVGGATITAADRGNIPYQPRPSLDFWLP